MTIKELIRELERFAEDERVIVWGNGEFEDIKKVCFTRLTEDHEPVAVLYTESHRFF